MTPDKIRNNLIYLINTILLLIYSGCFDTSGNLYINKIFPLFQKINYGIILIGLMIIFNNFIKRKDKIIKYNKWIVIFLVTIFLTTNISMRGIGVNYFYITMLLSTIIYSMLIAHYFSIEYIFRLLINTQFIIIIYTLYIVIVNPNIGLMLDSDGLVWKGAFSHKNSLAAQMSFGALLFYIKYITSNNRNKRIYILIFLMLDILILFKSGSKTSLLTLLLSIITINLYKKKFLKINPVYILIFINIAFYFIVSSESKILELITGILGKDITLTGRVYIWQAIADVIKQRPLTGYGYANFWNEYPKLNNYIWHKAGFYASGSHNGILEWVLLIGSIGLTILIINLIITGYKSIKINNLKIKYLSIGYLVYLLTYYLSERATNPLDYKMFLLFLVIALNNKNYKKEMNYKYKGIKNENIFHLDNKN